MYDINAIRLICFFYNIPFCCVMCWLRFCFRRSFYLFIYNIFFFISFDFVFFRVIDPKQKKWKRKKTPLKAYVIVITNVSSPRYTEFELSAFVLKKNFACFKGRLFTINVSMPYLFCLSWNWLSLDWLGKISRTDNK
jgi:hypothetical protein